MGWFNTILTDAFTVSGRFFPNPWGPPLRNHGELPQILKSSERPFLFDATANISMYHAKGGILGKQRTIPRSSQTSYTNHLENTVCNPAGHDDVHRRSCFGSSAVSVEPYQPSGFASALASLRALLSLQHGRSVDRTASFVSRAGQWTAAES